jgi:flagellar hook-associated protein FlgK
MSILSKLLGIDRIFSEVKLLRNQIMTTVAELEAKVTTLVDRVTSETAQSTAKLQSLADEIKALKDQIATGSPATQADLDRLASALDTIIVAVGNIIPDAPVTPV